MRIQIITREDNIYYLETEKSFTEVLDLISDTPSYGFIYDNSKKVAIKVGEIEAVKVAGNQ